MENHFTGDDSAGRVPVPSPSQARDVLSALEADGSRLAQKVVTPWWYHVALGGIVALFVASQALPSAAASAVVALGIVALPVLITTYTRRYGVSLSQPAGPRSKRLLIVTFSVLVVAMVGGLSIKLGGLNQWWVLVPAILAFVATVVFGRRYDDVLRSEIAGRGGRDA